MAVRLSRCNSPPPVQQRETRSNLQLNHLYEVGPNEGVAKVDEGDAKEDVSTVQRVVDITNLPSEPPQQPPAAPALQQTAASHQHKSTIPFPSLILRRALQLSTSLWSSPRVASYGWQCPWSLICADLPPRLPPDRQVQRADWLLRGSRRGDVPQRPLAGAGHDPALQRIVRGSPQNLPDPPLTNASLPPFPSVRRQGGQVPSPSPTPPGSCAATSPAARSSSSPAAPPPPASTTPPPTPASRRAAPPPSAHPPNLSFPPLSPLSPPSLPSNRPPSRPRRPAAPPQELATTRCSVALVALDSRMDPAAYEKAFAVLGPAAADTIGVALEGEAPYRRAEAGRSRHRSLGSWSRAHPG